MTEPGRVLPPNEQHEWQAKAIAAGWVPPWQVCSCTAPTDVDRDCPQHGEQP